MDNHIRHISIGSLVEPTFMQSLTHVLHHKPFQKHLDFITEFTDDTQIELYHSLHLSHILFLFHCITHSLIFHVMTHPCCITSPSLFTCTISPLITNTLPHFTTLDHSQQHSPHSKTSSLSPSIPHPIIPHHASFTVDLSPSNCLILLPNKRLANCSTHLTSFHSTSHSQHLHFTITSSNQMHICGTPNALSKPITHPT